MKLWWLLKRALPRHNHHSSTAAPSHGTQPAAVTATSRLPPASTTSLGYFLLPVFFRPLGRNCHFTDKVAHLWTITWLTDDVNRRFQRRTKIKFWSITWLESPEWTIISLWVFFETPQKKWGVLGRTLSQDMGKTPRYGSFQERRTAHPHWYLWTLELPQFKRSSLAAGFRSPFSPLPLPTRTRPSGLSRSLIGAAQASAALHWHPGTDAALVLFLRTLHWLRRCPQRLAHHSFSLWIPSEQKPKI